ncbi:MAG TPA: bifunctional diaminohydroxyphosphoribosylaminopyrimidine deaminase/5-amino-6-(5-phosphoribosylamino)uracil reductase RibD [Chitinophagaceae bacterium]|nr:bifunctional diaminohydroxyphosphoribosylaminopyrimidine deaminase/5-amino-6-(5-phosphoribosylamino)uracil reductase RibD [Chitinophagaceae bacterium]
MEKQERYMQRCLHLARLGEGEVAPNPMVGAVLVFNDRIIGEGYHKAWGGPHAEVNCLASIREEDKRYIADATLYVSLEPCAHYGKTPPCADLIIASGIQHVVVGCTDPFSKVAGKGIEKLKAAGVAVTVGILEHPCRLLNKRFVTFQEKKRPYILLKWVQSADGCIAGENHTRVAISNEYTARLVHRWRSQNSSILVGTITALADDPELTTRLWPGKNATRLVLDKTLRLPLSLKLFNGSQKTIVFNTIRQEEKPNLIYYKLSGNGEIAAQIMDALYNLKIQSVLVEGGTQLLQTFINDGLWDEANVITNQKMVLSNGVRAPQLQQHILKQTGIVFTDVIHYYANQNNT